MKSLVIHGELQVALVVRLLAMHAEIKEGEPDAVLVDIIVGDALRQAKEAGECPYPACKCIVSTSTSQPIPKCPKGLLQ